MNRYIHRYSQEVNDQLPIKYVEGLENSWGDWKDIMGS
jgi:hypothetical protein